MEEIRINISQGKYPKESFTGILKSIFPGETRNKKEVLKVQCQDGSEFMVMGIGQATKEDTPGYTGVGSFVNSMLKAMSAAGIVDPYAAWIWDGGQIMGFKTVPDYAGARCRFICTHQKKVGTEEQTTEYPPEWTVEKYEPPVTTTTQTQTTPGKYPEKKVAEPEKPTANKEMIDKWYGILLELPEPTNERGLQKYTRETIKDDVERKQINDVRTACLEQLVKSGDVQVSSDGKYSVK